MSTIAFLVVMAICMFPELFALLALAIISRIGGKDFLNSLNKSSDDSE